jgi:heme/copper-type cytochrome/quinol oxidase subunit 1
MTTIDTHAQAATQPAATSFFEGIVAWTITTDHKRIGRMFVGFGLIGLLTVCIVGVLLGIERADSSALLDSGSLVQLIQSQRLGLVFAGLAPVTLGLAIAVVPLQLGSRQIAFPRLALTGFYGWLGGLVLTSAALVRNGGMGGGDAAAVDLFLAGHGLLVIGLLAAAGSVAASVLTTRAPGMTMRRVPLFAWSALVGSLAVLVAMPVMVGALIYIFIDHRLGQQLNFLGGESILDWIGWAYTVPAIVVFAIPAVGVSAELLPVSFRQRQVMRGVTFAGIALVGVTALSAATQQFVHPVTFDTDQAFGDFLDDLLPFLIFAGLPVLGLLIVLALGARTAKAGMGNGRPRLSAALAFTDLGLLLLTAGVAANAVQAITNLELLGTVFEEGATLLVVYGSATAVLGGVAFWAPKLWGRVLPDAKLLPIVLLAAAGTVLAAGPLLVAGFLDQPGGIPVDDVQATVLLDVDYHSTGELWNILSLIGHGLMALAVLAFGGLMVATFTGRGESAARNPFGAHTIEWSADSPAPADNFAEVPTVASAEPLFETADQEGGE